MPDNSTEFHTFNAKSKTGFYKLLVFLEVGVTCLLLFLGYIFVFKVQKPTSSQVSKASQTLSQTPQSPTTKPIKFEVAHSYDVVTIGDVDITLKGDEGQLVIPKSGPGVSIFNGTPAEHTDATVADLQIGQKVILEIIAGEKVWVYIF